MNKPQDWRHYQRRSLWLSLLLVLAACSGATPEVGGPDTPPTTSPISTAEATSEPGPDPTAVADPTPSPEPVTVPSEVGPDGFDDHTVGSIASVDEFNLLASSDDSGRSVTKFIIPDLDAEGVRWFDSSFYQLHDEWYWFRLLNGYEAWLLPTEPVDGLSFESIDEVYAWAMAQDDLPLDLAFAGDGDRLYSQRYYQLALRDRSKTYGIGSLVHFPPNEVNPTDRWVLQTEFSEATTPVSIEAFLDRLSETLPAEIVENLGWVVGSPRQNETAEVMLAENAKYADRIVQYRDLVVAGEVSVYNPGIAAGRLRLIDEDNYELTDATDSDILIVDNVPDWLPPASALLSAAPQTPLAHVNLLARNRGIPNVSLSGLADNTAIIRAARVRAYVIVSASGTDQLDIAIITEEEFVQWQGLEVREAISVPFADPTTMPITIDLTTLATTIVNEADVDGWRPTIGGKSAGFLALLSADNVSTPDSPLAITVAPYLEHLAELDTELTAMLSYSGFEDSSRTRFLLLEGPKDFAEDYTSDDDVKFLEDFTGRFDADDPVRRVVEAGGFKDMFRDLSIAADTLESIMGALNANFGSYAETQGLRFRSSSSVEDIEGFSGAGLYDSNTGFVVPDQQPEEKDQKKSVERAIKKTWASYWGFEAFEERRRENVDHRSGAMGVLVHARFDDPLEMNNGVATFTLLPESSLSDTVAVINVQVDDVSVTNPDPSEAELPELIEVTSGASGDLSIERLANSTLAPNDEILNDGAVEELFGQLEAVTRLWRERVNQSLPSDQQIETVTLDFEFKTMDQGWPTVADSVELRESRLVVKQARSLDPGLRGLPPEVLAIPAGRDVVARATSVDRLACAGGIGFEILTNPLLSPDMGFSEVPMRVGNLDADIERDECEVESLYASPEHFLTSLLAKGEAIALN